MAPENGSRHAIASNAPASRATMVSVMHLVSARAGRMGRTISGLSIGRRPKRVQIEQITPAPRDLSSPSRVVTYSRNRCRDMPGDQGCSAGSLTESRPAKAWRSQRRCSGLSRPDTFIGRPGLVVGGRSPKPARVHRRPPSCETAPATPSTPRPPPAANPVTNTPSQSPWQCSWGPRCKSCIRFKKLPILFGYITVIT